MIVIQPSMVLGCSLKELAMGTPISPLDMTTVALLDSEFSEERELGQEVAGRMEQLVAQIQPIMRYLINGNVTRFVAETDAISGDTLELHVGGNGRWVVFNKKTMAKYIAFDHERMTSPWLFFPAKEVTDGLLKLLEEVERAREQRLTSIREARRKFQEIARILSN